MSDSENNSQQQDQTQCQDMSNVEREAILGDFPKPNSLVLQAHRLDELVKHQLTKKGKDQQFGSERTLFKLQQQLLEVSVPLTCLWSDMMNPDTNLSIEEIILLLRRALVMLGSTSHAISLERQRIACMRINPKLMLFRPLLAIAALYLNSSTHPQMVVGFGRVYRAPVMI